MRDVRREPRGTPVGEDADYYRRKNENRSDDPCVVCFVVFVVFVCFLARNGDPVSSESGSNVFVDSRFEFIIAPFATFRNCGANASRADVQTRIGASRVGAQRRLFARKVREHRTLLAPLPKN